MESVHAMVRGRAVGKGPVQAGTSLAAYPTAGNGRKCCRPLPRKIRATGRKLDCFKPSFQAGPSNPGGRTLGPLYRSIPVLFRREE